MEFQVKEAFYKDGEEFKIISGGMHYFRILPQYWQDRLEKLKALGCNTVETVIPWNLHEPKKGEFHFTGQLDLKHFVTLAQQLGLFVILRPSPYICGEWEFGGFPYWLLKEDGMKLRCAYPPFLKHVKEYYEKLFEIIAPLQITNGGPVIGMQIENEYGYYGNDKTYLNYLKDLMRSLGTKVWLFTSDGPYEESVACGGLEDRDILPTFNFGSFGKEKHEILKKIVGQRPMMCMEYWVGWFDAWGDEVHHTGDIKEHVRDLDELLTYGSVNFYMVCGGTNFGFMNGANYYEKLAADVTSYDYDALLAENGDITDKYFAYQDVIQKYTDVSKKEMQRISKKQKAKSIAYGEMKLTRSTGLFGNLLNISKSVESLSPICMEKLDQAYGYVLYESDLLYEKEIKNLRLLQANDRADIYFDQKKEVTLYDKQLAIAYTFQTPLQEKKKISILVENMGRVNFGPAMEMQRKGIDGDIVINDRKHYGWKQYSLPMEDISHLDYTKELHESEPGFYEFAFEVKEVADTYLDTTGWGKGCVFVNNFLLGRFWDIGPQKNLYIPSALLKQGDNKIIIFETQAKRSETICLTDQANLGKCE